MKPLVVPEFRYVDAKPRSEEKALNLVGDYIRKLEQQQEMMLKALKLSYTCLRSHKLTGLPIQGEYLDPAIEASKVAIENITRRPS
jgi:hypothetical protein